MQTQMVTNFHKGIAEINVRLLHQLVSLTTGLVINLLEQRIQAATSFSRLRSPLESLSPWSIGCISLKKRLLPSST